jgi:GxxExxY protein
MLYKDITEKVIAAAMQVHRNMGSGFMEIIYQRTLEIEMTLTGLNFEREREMPIYYRDVQIGTRRVDFFVDNKIMVELKAVADLNDIHLAQA